MHPSQAREIDWDGGNARELGRHSISLADVLEVFANDPAWGRNRRNRSGDYKIIGQTNGGRRLTIIMLAVPNSDRARPVTGWDSTKGEITRYGR